MQEDLECASPEIRRKIEELYDKLDEARRPIRLKIWNYHKQKKPNYDTAKDDFDSIRVTSSRYEMESHMELLFYRASFRDYSMAKEAWRQQSGPEAKYEATPIDEIEDSEYEEPVALYIVLSKKVRI